MDVKLFIIDLTGIAMMQTYSGCQFLPRDCCVEGNAGWLTIVQGLLALYLRGLWAGAAIQVVGNLVRIPVLTEQKQGKAKLNNENQSPY